MSLSAKQKKISWRTLPSIRIDVGRDTSLGTTRFSKATVDCSLLRSCSKWGTVSNLSPSPQDVGLLYLKISLYQPPDCRLRYVEAETEVTRQTPKTGEGPYISIAHPEQVYGRPWQEAVETQFDFSPHAEGAGFGGDLGGVFRKTNSERQYRWTFTLQKHPDVDGEYTKLAWKWEAQRKDASAAFERPIHAAVVVGHDKTPFAIRTYITGKFESRIEGFKYLIIERAEGQVVPLVPDSTASPEDLTTIIEELQQSIEDKNRKQAPVGKFLQNSMSVVALTRA
ncbi:unnamed protein product [Aureobasidium vineae]|uniref:Uncharacterized protein n=1 Tax=Aureobasidium vineae TaxID=2773715 RepID=A0A9N8JGR2_9PEZI|nr:unnamed protein product [Aureobasidium vineae]